MFNSKKKGFIRGTHLTMVFILLVGRCKEFKKMQKQKKNSYFWTKALSFYKHTS